MKKLILFLLPFLAMAQNPTNFPYGIKNTVAPTNSTPTYVITQEVDGVHKKTPAALFAKADSLATRVPYTGALQNVNLGEYGVSGGYLKLDTTPTSIPTTLGTISWDTTYRTASLIDGIGNTNLQIGQEQRILVHNSTGSTITDGQVVYVTGSTGDLPSVALANANSESTSSRTIGVATESIPNGGSGFIVTSGEIHSLNTLAFNEGDLLWLSTTNGTFTNVAPISPNHLVLIGYVIKKSGGNGSILVKIQNTQELRECSDVLFTALTNNDVLTYETASGLWKNKSVSTALGYTPANDANVLHKTGNETFSGVKTSENTGIVGSSLIVKNNDPTNRDAYMQFINASGTWDLGLKDSSGTLFQVKTENVPALNIDRFTGNVSVGLNSAQPYNTLFVKNNSAGGDTSLLVQSGSSQTSKPIRLLDNGNQEIFSVDKSATILYGKNANKMIVISGDSWSNDVSQFGVAGDFPTYFLYNQKNHDWQHVVTAVAGRTVATMLANYTAEITPYARNYEHQERMLMLYGGINDLFASRTATDIYNDLKSMWSNAKAQGFITIAYTVCSATTLTAPQEAERVSLNTMILSDRTLYDYVIQAAVLFQDPSNTLFFDVDGTHLNTNGAEYLGKRTYEYIYKDYVSVQPTQAINIGNGKQLFTEDSYKGSSFVKSGGLSTEYLKADGSVSTLTNPITGIGTTNYIPIFTGGGTIGNSAWRQSATGERLYYFSDNGEDKFQVVGSGYFQGITSVMPDDGRNMWLKSTSGNLRFRAYGNAISGATIAALNPAETAYNPITISASKTMFGVDGNVLINTTTDNGYKLDVNGTTRISGITTLGSVINLKSYTVATLPAGAQGDMAYVTDATAPTYLGTLTGGGSVKCPVFYNGTTWVSH